MTEDDKLKILSYRRKQSAVDIVNIISIHMCRMS